MGYVNKHTTIRFLIQSRMDFDDGKMLKNGVKTSIKKKSITCNQFVANCV